MRRSHRACLLSASKKYFWKKYSISYQSVVSGSDSSTLSSITRYFGTTYDFNSNTGIFTVEQTTSRSRTAVAIGDCFISLTISSGTQTGTIVNVVTTRATSTNNYTITYDVITSESIKGSYIEDVYNVNFLAYPINGIQDGYWYEMYDPEHIFTYTGNYLDEIALMDNKCYRLLTFTDSGILSFDKIVIADIWLCGGGGGGNASGGFGAFCNSTYNSNIKDLVISIGSGGSGSQRNSSSSGSNGGTSIISGDISLQADGGSNPKRASSGGTGCGGTYYYSDFADSCYEGGLGDGITKIPFNSDYFLYSYCDGGGGGAFGETVTKCHYGGNGGTNGGNGETSPGYSSSSGIGGSGGEFGGKGGDVMFYSGGTDGNNAIGYGSGGGGYGYSLGISFDNNKGGDGYQGVCFIRISL